MAPVEPRAKTWHERRLVSEHAFDKLRQIDCTFAEFEEACDDAIVIEETDLAGGVKELVLTVAWTRPLHVVVIVDLMRAEDRVVTVYEPDPARWSSDFRTRR